MSALVFKGKREPLVEHMVGLEDIMLYAEKCWWISTISFSMK